MRAIWWAIKAKPKKPCNRRLTLPCASKLILHSSIPFSVPATEAYRWAKENGYIKGDYSDYVKEDGTINCLLELPEISADEMVQFCDDARKKYYWRPGYILHRLRVGFTDPEDLKRSIKAFGRIKDFLIK